MMTNNQYRELHSNLFGIPALENYFFYDLNKDGFITFTDLQQNNTVTQAEFDVIDLDQDGIISPKEFDQSLGY